MVRLQHVGVVGLGRWRCQRLVGPERVPVRMMSLLRLMVTVSAVNVAIHPWSQRVPMEMREPEASVGKIWQAEGGSCGMLRKAVWVESMVLPSGSVTEMLGLAGQ